MAKYATSEEKKRAKDTNPEEYYKSRGFNVKREGSYYSVKDGQSEVYRFATLGNGWMNFTKHGETIGDNLSLVEHFEPGTEFASKVERFIGTLESSFKAKAVAHLSPQVETPRIKQAITSGEEVIKEEREQVNISRSASLIQKYQPKNFDEVVGHEEQLKGLINMLSKPHSENLQRSFLLSGGTGTGKTTIAHLIAQSVNCQSESELICNNCPSCKLFNQKSFQNAGLLEFNGANTSVEDVRDKILDKLSFGNLLGNKYDVYFIDEVHGLHPKSFEALLKELDHVHPQAVFLFATTEAEKLPETFKARSYQLPLADLSEEKLINHFNNILQAEKIRFEEGVLPKLAQASSGSVRNGLQLLQSAISQADNGVIKLHQVETQLGLMGEKLQGGNLLEHLYNNNPKELLKTAQVMIYQNGIKPEELLGNLRYQLNKVANCHMMGGSSEELISKYAQKWDENQTQTLLKTVKAGIKEFKLSANRIEVDSTLQELYLLNKSFKPEFTLPEQKETLQKYGRDYLINKRGIDEEVVLRAEKQGFLKYDTYGVLFVGYDEHHTPRSATKRSTIEGYKHDLEGSKKQFVPILYGSKDKVLVVEGGTDALAAQCIALKRGKEVPTVIVSGGSGAKGFLELPHIQEILKQAQSIVVCCENEKDPQTQKLTDEQHLKQFERIKEITSGQKVEVSTWHPKAGIKDIADMNVNEVQIKAQPRQGLAFS